MANHILRTAVAVAAVFLLAVTAMAQPTTSTLTGTVTTEGSPLPGVTVTISSPALQGTRNVVTNENGAYIFQAIPPGDYTVTFELSGMKTITKRTNVNLAQQARVDADLRVAAVTESLTVTATPPAIIETTEVSSNYSSKTIEDLPTDRNITAAVDLSPGVSEEGPNNQRMISGAPSYENLYLVNGAVINDSIRGQPEAVYIEDAIQETTIISGNASAEYGRFTGGVVSAITKSGGNDFSGSLRDSLSNDAWTRKTPYAGEAEHVDKINPIYEATLGGRIIRDRLWFFGAGRFRKTSRADQTLQTDIPFTRIDDERRWEGKLTGQIASSHSLVASYLDRLTKQTNNTFGSIVDLRSLTNRELPNTILAVNYNGILTTNLLLEAMYSQRKFTFHGGGAQSKDLIEGTIIRDISTGRRGWSPTFCGVCDDKKRDNEYWTLKSRYFFSTPSFGNHNFAAGYEDFAELRTENNEQGGSGYRVFGDFIYVGDKVFLSVDPSSSYIQNFPVLNRSKRSNSKTRSLFINDKWDLSNRFSFNVGGRYDKNDAVDQGGKKTSDDSAFSPRLSAMIDLFGNGRHRLNLGYNRYVSKIDNGINDETANAGTPAYFGYYYDGPEINPAGTPADQLLPTDEVLRRVFAWFDSVGGAKGARLRGAGLPGVNAQLAGSLASPKMDEYSIGYGLAIGSGGVLRADYIHRNWKDFYVDITNLGTGKVTDELGNVFDITLVGNNDTGLERRYDAWQLQGSLPLARRLMLQGNYTYSKLLGNADSETFNNATITLTSADSFPEYIRQSWNNPKGFLTGDVRHRANLWVSYDLPTPIGAFNFSVLERYHSGFPYSAAGTIDLSQKRTGIVNPGYEQPPTTATYYFNKRGAFRTANVTRTDLAVNYTLPIGGTRLFVQADILNAFNEDAIDDPTSLRTTVYTARNSQCKKANGSRCDYFNPLTTQPVEGVHYVLHRDFGLPTSQDAYQLPLTYRFSVGLKF